VKCIRLEEDVRAQIRDIPQRVALNILHAIHRYAEAGTGPVKALSGEFEGMQRLRIGDYRVFFRESPDAITVQRVANRKDAYR
jgi:mRNA-degrading endonuclease RelE of RelBE toxin-antitoxin system